MKLIDEKGKLFGIINIVDLIIIVIVVMLVAGGVKQVRNPVIEVEEKVRGEEKEALVVLEINKAKEYIVDGLVVGDVLYHNEEGTKFGKIIDKQVEERKGEEPSRYNVTLTIESIVEDTPKEIIIGGKGARVGSEFALKNKRVKTAGTIINMEVK